MLGEKEIFSDTLKVIQVLYLVTHPEDRRVIYLFIYLSADSYFLVEFLKLSK
jgi:hypothetical protein